MCHTEFVTNVLPCSCNQRTAPYFLSSPPLSGSASNGQRIDGADFHSPSFSPARHDTQSKHSPWGFHCSNFAVSMHIFSSCCFYFQVFSIAELLIYTQPHPPSVLVKTVGLLSQCGLLGDHQVRRKTMLLPKSLGRYWYTQLCTSGSECAYACSSMEGMV